MGRIKILGSRGVIEFENTYFNSFILEKGNITCCFQITKYGKYSSGNKSSILFVLMTLSEGLRAKNNALLPTPSTTTGIGAREICIKRRYGFKNMLSNISLI